MRFPKMFAWLALAVAVPGASNLMADDWYRENRDIRHDRRDLREDYRDVEHDYATLNRLREDVERDQWRLNEDIRCGRSGRAAADAADLARDQRAMRALENDIHYDRRDIERDHRDLRHDYWERRNRW